MRRLPLLLAFVLLIAIGVLLVARDRAGGPEPPAEPASAVTAAPRSAPLEAATGERGPSSQSPTPTPTAARTAVAPEPTAEPAEPPAPCVVLGRVADEQGLPLAGVPLSLHLYRVRDERRDMPHPDQRFEKHDFEAETDAAGAFRFEAPLLTKPRAYLVLRPDRFHDSLMVYFGFALPDSRPSLTEGVHDLGELRLAATGALSGRVTDANGAPLAGVQLMMGPDRFRSYERYAWTGSDGTYTLDHAPVGTHMVKAVLEGHTSGFLEPITVEAGRETLGVDFVLAAASTIRGIVVDERGHPLEGVRLSGSPVSSGGGAGARSAADGSFTVHLPRDEPYTLAAKLDGYRSWGDEKDRTVTYAPGTEDLRIVLESLPRTRFHVVDDETGDAIERFGLTILEDHGSKSSRSLWTTPRRPPLREHQGGIAEAGAREGLDLYIVAAEGYLLASGDVALDPTPEPVQTVRLRRGTVVRGRLVQGGSGVPEADVELIHGWMQPAVSPTSFLADRSDVHTTRTDAEGRFELRGVAASTHRLTVKPPRGAALLLVPLEVRRVREQDLGDLLLLPGANVAGEVLLPVGVEPTGLQILVDGGVAATTDATSRFHLEGLAPGPHTLRLAERFGKLAASAPLSVELVSGENPLVTLDARDRGVCKVTLTIELDGLATRDLRVGLVSIADPDELETLGYCNADGVVTGFVRGWGATRVVVDTSPVRRSLTHPEVRLQLEPGGSVEANVRFRFARLALRLPPGVAFPRDGTAQVRLVPALEGAWQQDLKLDFEAGTLATEGERFARFQDGTLFLGVLVPGRHQLRLRLVNADAEREPGPIPGLDLGFGKSAYYEGSSDVEFVAGEEQSVVLQ